ncbi:hypothetical protein LOK49_Contig35G00009 [Camellia lanceoleosa]|nr:hypothetical protein LOK49_Contig35G00009 [Camellia lanceoleosa]
MCCHLDDRMQFLNFLQARVRELKKIDHANHTITVLLVGIPNVGKSALANSLHHIGRISDVELKHATVSPLLGETRYQQLRGVFQHVSFFQLPLSVCVYHVIAEVLPPEIRDAEVRSKLALTGRESMHSKAVEKKQDSANQLWSNKPGAQG